MNVDIDYNDELEQKKTDPRLLPNPDKEKPFTRIPHPDPTVERSRARASNRRRRVLGSPIINSKSGPSQVEPNPNKTRNNKIPITKPNHVPQVTWADIARKESIRKNDTTKARPQDSYGWRGISRRYATRLAGLTG